MFLGTEFPFPWRRGAPATLEEERIASRAAALSLFLHASGAPGGVLDGIEPGPGNDPSSISSLTAVSPYTVVTPIQEAFAFLRGARGPYARRAFNMARARLAAATYAGSKEQNALFRPALVGLMGQQEVGQLEKALFKATDSSRLYELVPDAVRRMTYGLRPIGNARQDREEAPPCRGAERSLLRAPTTVPQGDSVVFDPRSLITTVQLCGSTRLPFGELKRLADPRQWEVDSLFWTCSRQIARDALGGWGPAPTAMAAPLGCEWKGNLFEEVEWSWNVDVGRVAAFDVILDINYQINTAAPSYNMEFSLNRSLGSMLYGTARAGGIEVDEGFERVMPHSQSTSDAPQFSICLSKCLRYSSLADRRTYQGPAMAGAFLNLMAPALVGLWLYELFDTFYSHEP
ncbi:hypothetical protein [Pyxidicoccus caerfyrddinensis]|uniref:hypothetical protein n=1 Tax=Pyxidicoccus caerfyrddinensis TaxID=2709663 RepID=UPI0013DBEF3E|nr:hypothetical protein [Pyxidicoccus caerfyrddinensis]